MGSFKHSNNRITTLDYLKLVSEHFPDGNVPQAVTPLEPRTTKIKRQFACTRCNYVASHRPLLYRHERDMHGVNLVWHACTELNPDGTPCNYKGKSVDDVRQHKRKFHGIDVRWHVCGQPGCEYKAKTAGDLKKHKANRHNIDVVWHYCQVPGCTFVCKQRNYLNQHAKWMHSGRTVTNPARAERNRVPEPWTNEMEKAMHECVPCAQPNA
jgi:hypothetical protein